MLLGNHFVGTTTISELHFNMIYFVKPYYIYGITVFIKAMPWCTVHLLQLHVPDNCYKFTVNHGVTGLITLFNAKRFILFWVELDLDAWFFERFTSVFGNVHDAFEFVLYRFVYFLYRL